MRTMNDFIPRVEQQGRAGGGPGKPGPIARFIGLLAGIALLIGAVLFSAVLLVVLVLAGAVVLGWFWWQTRAARRVLREQMREHMRANAAGPADPAAAERPMDAASRPLARRPADVSDAHIIREDQAPPPKG